MVNIDELNDNIGKFSTIINRLNELDKIYQTIDSNTKDQKKYTEKIEEIYFLQDGLNKEIKVEMNESQLRLSNKMDDVQSNIKDRISLSESYTKNQINENKILINQFMETNDKFIAEQKKTNTSIIEFLADHTQYVEKVVDKFKRSSLIIGSGIIIIIILQVVYLYLNFTMKI